MLPFIPLIAAAAPLIGSLFSSDKSDIVEEGVKLAAKALGCPPDTTSIENTLKNDPDALVKLKEFEFQERANILNTKVEMERIHATNTQGARDMTGNDRAFDLQRTVAYAIIGMVFLCIGGIVALFVFQPQSLANTALIALLSAVVGALLNEFGRLSNFCFGSTSGSREKDNLLYNSTPLGPNSQGK